MSAPVRITILVDNQAGPGLAAEHGFAAWIERDGRHWLFDAGQGAALVPNAQALGVPLATAEGLILSHGHYDHTGGLPALLAAAPAAQVHCHPQAKRLRYAVSGAETRSIGMPAAARVALATLAPLRRAPIAAALELAPGVGLTGPIPRIMDYEDRGGPFFVDAAGARPDDFADELALTLRTARGLVVILGCGHAGLINTLRQALALNPGARLCAVLGGFHLGGASEERLARTAAALRALDPELVVPCHCSGERAVAAFGEALGERVRAGAAGLALNFAA